MDSVNPPLREIFADAAEIADPAARAAFLDSACGKDVVLRQRVERLLAAHAGAGGFLRPVSDTTTAEVRAEKPGDRIGRYRLIQRIGRGGGGVVYLAEQEEPLRRKVALKILKAGMDTESVVARFEAERQTLALMDHPNIARVLDAGATEQGRPFFVMELVNGERLSEYCERRRLPVRQRLELFIAVCQAVQHAHQKGIIHRDLKPSNILVTEQEGAPVPKVIDFGIAKATAPGLDDRGGLTSVNQFLGTPAYMSPEQVGGARDIDTRTDIYSLGVILYELLAGQPPFDPRKLAEAGIDQIRHLIRQVDPPRPSTTITAALRGARPPGAPLPSRELIAAVRGDLDWIVMKCLEKDRARRYETANGVAMDIRRHLKHEAIVARPPTTLYRLRTTLRRHRLGFIVAALVALLLVVAVIVSGQLALRALRAEKVQSRLRGEAEAARADESRMRELAQRQAEERRLSLARLDIAQGNRLAEAGDPLSALLWFVEAFQLEQGDAVREENERLRIGWALRNAPQLLQMMFQGRRVETLAFSPDGQRIVTGGDSPAALVWNAGTGEELLGKLTLCAQVCAAQFSPDGLRVFALDATGTGRIWSAKDGQALSPLLQGPDYDADLRSSGVRLFRPAGGFSPDSQVLFTAWGSKSVHLWDGSNGKHLLTLAHPEAVVQGAFSPDSRYLATACRDRVGRIWDTRTGEQVNLVHASGAVSQAFFSPDGQRLYTVSDRKNIQGWDWRSGQSSGPELRAESVVLGVALSRDGQRLATAGADDSARVWDAASGQSIARFQHPAGVEALAFSPDGAWLATGSEDGYARVWDIGRDGLACALPQGPAVDAVAFSPDGRRLAAAGSGGVVRLWQLSAPGDRELVLRGPEIVWAEFSRDGKKVVTAGSRLDHAVRVWDAQSGSAITPWIPHPSAARFASFSHDGTRVLAFGEGKTAQILDAATGRPTVKPLQHPKRPIDGAWNADGTEVAVACDDAAGYLWDTADAYLRVFRHTNGVLAVALSEDGRLLATGGRDQMVQVWQLPSRSLVTAPLPQAGVVHQLRFNGDGSRLAVSCEQDATHACVELWEVAAGKLLGTLQHRNSLRSVEFSRDGRRIATAGSDRTARVWDGLTGRPITAPLAHRHEVYQATFTPDGARLATLTIGGDVRLWSADTGEPITPPISYPHAHSRGRLGFSPDGSRLLIATGGGATWLRQFARDESALADLVQRAQMLSGQRIDAAAGLTTLDIASVSNAWGTLHTAPRAR